MVSFWVIGVTLLLVLLTVALSLLKSFYKKCRMLKAIPGWPTHWLWGNLQQLKMDQENLMKQLSYVQEYRHKMVVMWLGPFKPVLMITHCSVVQNVIKLPKDEFSYGPFKPWLGSGLISVTENERWSRNRHLLTPAFHYNILKGYAPVTNSCLEVLLKQVDSFS